MGADEFFLPNVGSLKNKSTVMKCHYEVLGKYMC